MSTEQTSGQQGQSSGADQQTEQTVPKSHADKILGEKKAIQAKLKEMQDKLDAIEREKLEKEGNLQALVDRYKKNAESKEEEVKTFKNRIVQDRLKYALKAEAEKAGVIKFDILEKIVDFEKITIDPESLEVDMKDLSKTINSLKAENPFLFKNTAIKPNDLTPSSKATGEVKSSDLSSLSEQELKELLSQVK